MAILTINDNPSISDTIVFTLNTPNSAGCLLNNPYEVNSVIIYFVERDFTSGNLNEYDIPTYNVVKLQTAIEAEAVACANPTVANLQAAKIAQQDAQSSIIATPFYYNEATPVQIVGNNSYPAWLSTDLPNAFLTQVNYDSNNNPVYGQFTYTWEPAGQREGDYFICWTWTMLPAGDQLSSHVKFTLGGDTTVTTTIPTHFTDPTKYPTLLDRYTPEMFKMIISNNDLTPQVLDKFNGAIGLGFTQLENLANQIVDLQDANSLQETMLPYLSNLFDLKLKTTDPTRWRGQIKRAVPLFKSKGTRKGLAEAFEYAAIKMLGLTQLWEIISSHTWQEAFVFDGTNYDFVLQKIAMPIDYENFELWLRDINSNVWIPLTSDYVDFNTYEGVTTMSWVGGNLSIDPIDLVQGDEIKVLYLYNDIINDAQQTIENYIRTLPLMDQRDERRQIYPLKNWNVRVIASSDPLFDLVIPNRNPFCDPLIYGKVRTEFPYSENIYNMEEYNGSIRNSKDPCDIDRTFVDPCTACMSSCYNLDLEVENISDDRISEVQDILAEYTPFHSVLHTVNFIGSVQEFIESPVEDIEALITINGSEFVVAGEAQMWFNRVMKLINTNGILRDSLADSSIAVSTTSAIGYNDTIVMFCPEMKLDNIGMALDGDAVVHILSPSPLEGFYLANNPSGNVVSISSVSEPITNCNSLFASDGTLNGCAFTFDINNPVLNGTLCNIAQDNIFKLADATQNFGELMAQSSFDVSHGTAISAWAVLIPSYDPTVAYTIQDISPDGELILINHGNLPGSNAINLTYQLMNGSNSIISSSNGAFTVIKRGRVTALSSSVQPIYNVLKLENFYHILSGTEFPVIGFVNNTTDQYYIGNYQDNMGNNRGDINSVNLQINQKIADGEVGYLSHRGMKLQMTGNLESSLGIQNGANSLVVVDDGIQNDGFKENFLITIGSDNYFIADIDGNNPTGYTTITLSGTSYYWKTLNAGGTSLNATIYHYTKQGATIAGQQYDLPTYTFPTLDRNGHAIIQATFDENNTVESLSVPNGNEFTEYVKQTEGISFSIEYTDGTNEQGVIL